MVCMIVIPLCLFLVVLGVKTNGTVTCVFLVTIASLYVAYTMARDVLSIKLLAEHEDMLAVSEPIREGSEGFFRYPSSSRPLFLLWPVSSASMIALC